MPASAGSGVSGNGASAGATGQLSPDCTGADPAVCVDVGFQPSIDGFNFPNWASVGTLDATALVALFGEDAVCAEVSASGCVLYPAAQQWVAQVNDAMMGGHCEGMAVLAQRLFAKQAVLADLVPTAKSVFDLSKDDKAVTGAIEFWWATQMLTTVQDAYMAFHDYEPSQIAAELASGLTSGQNYTLAIYSDTGSGHSITPFAVAFDGKVYQVSVYDNNFPGKVNQVTIDPATEQWNYASASTKPGATTSGWSGGKATIDLTPMSSRTVPALAPFTDGAARGSVLREESTSRLMVTSADSGVLVGFTLTVKGKRYDTTDPSVVLPSGIWSRPFLGAGSGGNGAIVFVNRKTVKEFKAEAVARSDETGAPKDQASVTMSVDGSGVPRVTVRTKTRASQGDGSFFAVDQRGGVDVAGGRNMDSDVNVANGMNSVDAPLPGGAAFNVGPRDRRGGAEVGFVDPNGNVRPGFRVDGRNPEGRVIDTSIQYDPASGEITRTQSFPPPVAVDGSRVDTYRALNGAGNPPPPGGPGTIAPTDGAPPSGQDPAGPAPGGQQSGAPGPDTAPGGGGPGAPAPGPAPGGGGGGPGAPAPGPAPGGGGPGAPAPGPAGGA